MKTILTKLFDDSCTPSGGVVMTDTSPQRGPSQAAGGVRLFKFLTNVRECIVCFLHFLSNPNHLGYKSPYNNFYVKFGLSSRILPLLFVGISTTAFAMPLTSIVGAASWYSSECCKFNKSPECPTASGKSLYQLEKNHEQFAASYAFPLGTRVKVTNLGNGKSTTVSIVDRGPNRRLNRKIDLGKESFARIADPKKGLISVSMEVLS